MATNVQVIFYTCMGMSIGSPKHATYFRENWLPLKILTSAVFNPYCASASA